MLIKIKFVNNTQKNHAIKSFISPIQHDLFVKIAQKQGQNKTINFNMDSGSHHMTE